MAAADADRNYRRRNVTATPADWAGIEALSHRLAPRWAPGRAGKGNVSEALRCCYYFLLEAERRGIIAIDDRGVRFAEPRPSPGTPAGGRRGMPR